MEPIASNLEETTKEVSPEIKELTTKMEKADKHIYELFRRSHLVDKGIDDLEKNVRKELKSLKVSIEGLGGQVLRMQGRLRSLLDEEDRRQNEKLQKHRKKMERRDTIESIVAIAIVALAGFGLIVLTSIALGLN